MFHDFDALITKLLKADPEWQHDAVKSIERTLADHDDWCRSGKPPYEVWGAFKWLRNPESYRWSNRPMLLEKLTALDIVDPCPITEQEWAKANPLAAENAIQAQRDVEARLSFTDADAPEEQRARQAQVAKRQKEL